jgi:ribosomal protein L22
MEEENNITNKEEKKKVKSTKKKASKKPTNKSDSNVDKLNVNEEKGVTVSPNEKSTKKEMSEEINEEKQIKTKDQASNNEENKPSDSNNTEKTKEDSDKKQDLKKSSISSKKETAVANAYSLPISLKHTKFICKMIKRKSPQNAIEILKKIASGKLAVKMTGLEVPHQKGKGIAGARFPKTAAMELINVVKQLNANSVVNGINDPVIRVAMPNLASQPVRRGGRRSKRTHIHFEVTERSKLTFDNK